MCVMGHIMYNSHFLGAGGGGGGGGVGRSKNTNGYVKPEMHHKDKQDKKDPQQKSILLRFITELN